MKPVLVNSQITRGCGVRIAGALYACVSPLAPSQDEGAATYRTIEDYLIDPPLPWHEGHFRGIRYLERSDGSVDVLQCVGREYYPHVSDFVEEARQHGISRRLPLTKDIDYGRLSPHQSRLVFIHSRARAVTGCHLRPMTDGVVPLIGRDPHNATGVPCSHPMKSRKGHSPCVFSTWDLGALDEDGGERHQVVASNDTAQITTPSVAYRVNRPKRPTKLPEYEWGIFMAIPLSHLEYVNPSGTIPEPVAARLGATIHHTAVTPQ